MCRNALDYDAPESLRSHISLMIHGKATTLELISFLEWCKKTPDRSQKKERQRSDGSHQKKKLMRKQRRRPTQTHNQFEEAYSETLNDNIFMLYVSCYLLEGVDSDDYVLGQHIKLPEGIRRPEQERKRKPERPRSPQQKINSNL